MRLHSMLLAAFVVMDAVPAVATDAKQEEPQIYVASVDLNGGNGSVSRYIETTGVALDDIISSDEGGLEAAESIALHKSYLFVADNSVGNVLRYDQATHALVEFIPTGSGGLQNPDMLYFRKGVLYVSDRFSGSIKRYNWNTGKFIDTLVQDDRLNGFIGFTFGPDGNIYAGMFNGVHEVLRFDGRTGTFIDVFTKNHPVLDLAAFAQLTFGPDGNLYASRYHGNLVERYDGKTGDFIDTFASVNMDTPDYLIFTKCSHQMLVGNLDSQNITKYDARSGTYLGTFASLSSRQPVGLAEYAPEGCDDNPK